MKSLLVLLVLAVFSLSAFPQPGYRIEVKIDGLRDTTLMLGYHFGEKKFVADTALIDSRGVAVFQRDTLLPGGMYLVILPERTYFDILLGENQRFSLSTSTQDLFANLRFVGSPENNQFLEYQKFMGEMQRRMEVLREEMQAVGDDKVREQSVMNQMNNLDRQVNEYWDKIVEKNQGTFLANLIRSIRPVAIPEFQIPDGTNNPDSVRWVMSYNFNQRHYLDNIDLADERLLRTPFVQGRVDMYFDRLLLQIPDTISKYATKVIERTRPSPRMFQYMVSHLLNKYQTSNIMGMDAVFVHIAEQYYLSGLTPWVTPEIIEKIRERVNDLKPNLIGQIAPNVSMWDANGRVVSLHSVKGEATVVYFWEPTCSHCLKVTPELKKIYDKFRNRGVSVVAVYTQGDRDAWVEHVAKHELNWINLWDPNRSSNYHKLYDIFSTPVLYVLDRDKRIVAKRIGVEALERFLEEEIR